MSGHIRAETAQSPACPLCGGGRHDLIETISYADIRHVYERLYRLELPPREVDLLQYLRCTSCDLRFFVPQLGGDPAFYEQLQALPWYYLEDKTDFRIAQRLIPPDSEVLELGCGAGAFAGFLPSGCAYRGLEYNDEAIRKARLRGLSVDRISVEELARAGGSMFDVICSFQVLEHVLSPRSFLTAAASLLRPGGTLVIAVPAEDSFLSYTVNNVLNLPPHHLTRWTDTALRNVARVIGLTLIHLEHDEVSGDHVLAFAQAEVDRGARRLLGRPSPMLSRVEASYGARALLRLLSIPLARRMRVSPRRPPGHSVIAAYRKP